MVRISTYYDSCGTLWADFACTDCGTIKSVIVTSFDEPKISGKHVCD